MPPLPAIALLMAASLAPAAYAEVPLGCWLDPETAPIQKSGTGEVFCVSNGTYGILVERGWGTAPPPPAPEATLTYDEIMQDGRAAEGLAAETPSILDDDRFLDLLGACHGSGTISNCTLEFANGTSVELGVAAPRAPPAQAPGGTAPRLVHLGLPGHVGGDGRADVPYTALWDAPPPGANRTHTLYIAMMPSWISSDATESPARHAAGTGRTYHHHTVELVHDGRTEYGGTINLEIGRVPAGGGYIILGNSTLMLVERGPEGASFAGAEPPVLANPHALLAPWEGPLGLDPSRPAGWEPGQAPLLPESPWCVPGMRWDGLARLLGGAHDPAGVMLAAGADPGFVREYAGAYPDLGRASGPPAAADPGDIRAALAQVSEIIASDIQGGRGWGSEPPPGITYASAGDGGLVLASPWRVPADLARGAPEGPPDGVPYEVLHVPGAGDGAPGQVLAAFASGCGAADPGPGAAAGAEAGLARVESALSGGAPAGARGIFVDAARVHDGTLIVVLDPVHMRDPVDAGDVREGFGIDAPVEVEYGPLLEAGLYPEVPHAAQCPEPGDGMLCHSWAGYLESCIPVQSPGRCAAYRLAIAEDGHALPVPSGFGGAPDHPDPDGDGVHTAYDRCHPGAEDRNGWLDGDGCSDAVPGPDGLGIVLQDGFEGGLGLWDARGWQAGASAGVAQIWGHTILNGVASAGGCDAGPCTLELAAPLDLSQYSAATLEFDRYVGASLDEGEYLGVEVHDGDASESVRWEGGAGGGSQWHREGIDLGGFLRDGVSVRFSAEQSMGTEKVAIDNLAILGTAASGCTLEPAASLAPGGLLEVRWSGCPGAVRYEAHLHGPGGPAPLGHVRGDAGFAPPGEAGTYHVAARAQQAGYAYSAPFSSNTVTVPERDAEPPELRLPGTVTATADVWGDATIYFEVWAHDRADGAVPIHCSHPPAAVFGVGTTEVSCTASDLSGNAAEGAFEVVVSEWARPSWGLGPEDFEREPDPRDAAYKQFTPP